MVSWFVIFVLLGPQASGPTCLSSHAVLASRHRAPSAAPIATIDGAFAARRSNTTRGTPGDDTQKREPARARYAPDFDRALEEASQRGVPLLFVSFDAWEAAPWSPWFTSPTVTERLDRVVVLIASQEDHGNKVEEVDGTPRKVCSLFGQITCHDHQRVLDRYFQEFVGEGGAVITPHFILVSPERQIIESVEHEFEQQDLTGAIDRVMRQFPDGLGKTAYDRAIKLLAQAEIDIRARLLEDGVPLLREAIRLTGRSPLAKRSRALLTKVESIATEVLERADQDAARGKLFEALVSLDDLAADLDDLGPDRVARERIAEILRLPEARGLRTRLKNHGRARTLFRKAMALEREGKEAEALRSYQKVAKRYGDSPLADMARQKAARLEKDHRPPRPEPREEDA